MDANGYVLDETTGFAPHLMDPPLLVNAEGIPYEQMLQRFIAGHDQIVEPIYKTCAWLERPMIAGLGASELERLKAEAQERTMREAKRIEEIVLAAMQNVEVEVLARELSGCNNDENQRQQTLSPSKVRRGEGETKPITKSEKMTAYKIMYSQIASNNRTIAMKRHEAQRPPSTADCSRVFWAHRRPDHYHRRRRAISSMAWTPPIVTTPTIAVPKKRKSE